MKIRLSLTGLRMLCALGGGRHMNLMRFAVESIGAYIYCMQALWQGLIEKKSHFETEQVVQ